MVQASDKTKRLSKQQAADLVDKEHDNEIRRSVKRSNLVRQQEFKKMKKNQKKTEKIRFESRRCIRFNYSTYNN